MRVSLRLTLLSSLLGLVLFGGSGVLQSVGENRDLHNAIRRELSLLGRSTKVGVEHALRDDRSDQVTRLLTKLEELDPELDVFVIGADGQLRWSSPGARPRPFTLTNRETVFFAPGWTFSEATFSSPITSEAGAPLGTLVIVRSLEDARHDLVLTELHIAATVVLFMLCTTLLTYIAAEVGVGRPIARLIQAMRESRSGTWTRVRQGNRTDEVTALEAEFNRMQEELRHAHLHLQEEAERRQSLQQALQRADKLVTVGQLAAGLAHEIGSPLQVLRGRAAQLRDKPLEPARTVKVATILVEQTERIQRIVERLLNHARRHHPEHVAVDLGAAARGVLELVAVEARHRGVHMALEVDSDAPLAAADRDGMQQVVLNLVRNALAACGENAEVSLRVSRGPRLTAASGVEANSVRLTVNDTGEGISTDAMGHLFESFYTTRSDEGGTGLGLAVVKFIVEEHGGHIHVQSQPGAGTRFEVDVPAMPSQPSEPTNAS